MTRARILTLIPVVLFCGLAVLFWKGLSGDPSSLPSNLLGKTAPAFELAAVEGLNVPGLRQQDLSQGRVTVVNIWASWCGPCRLEHPFLMELSKRSDLVLVGINNKDDAANAVRFLSTLGQPFSAVGADTTGRVTIDWGGYGVPETFIIDGQGVIRYKHVGPLSSGELKGKFADQLNRAQQALR